MNKAEEKRQDKTARLEEMRRQMFGPEPKLGPEPKPGSSPMLASERDLINSFGTGDRAPEPLRSAEQVPTESRDDRDQVLREATAPPTPRTLIVGVGSGLHGNEKATAPAAVVSSEGQRAATDGINPHAARDVERPADPSSTEVTVEPDSRSPLVVTPSEATGNAVLFKELAKEIRAYEYPEYTRRKAIAVTKDAFSRVSYLAYEEKLDKLEVVTYLLDRHTPKDKTERLPLWLQQAPPEADRVDYLAYLEYEDLDRRLRWLRTRFLLRRVDIVERAVAKFLAASPYQLPSKQRHVGGYMASRSR